MWKKRVLSKLVLRSTCKWPSLPCVVSYHLPGLLLSVCVCVCVRVCVCVYVKQHSQGVKDKERRSRDGGGAACASSALLPRLLHLSGPQSNQEENSMALSRIEQSPWHLRVVSISFPDPQCNHCLTSSGCLCCLEISFLQQSAVGQPC